MFISLFLQFWDLFILTYTHIQVQYFYKIVGVHSLYVLTVLVDRSCSNWVNSSQNSNTIGFKVYYLMLTDMHQIFKRQLFFELEITLVEFNGWQFVRWRVLRTNFSRNSCHVNTIMNFGKISSKTQKNSYSHKNASKPIVQAHGTSSHFLAHDPSSWVSLGEFWELWFGEPRSMFSKTPVI